MSQQRRSQGPLLRFTKMHGLGNDFMVVDAIIQPFRLRPDTIRDLANRNFGIGFDQLLVVEPPGLPDVDFRYRIFNADGSEVEQCGNGARCFARFVRDQHLTNKKVIRVQTAKGVIELRVGRDGMVMVNMGVPELNPGQLSELEAVVSPILKKAYERAGLKEPGGDADFGSAAADDLDQHDEL